MLHLDAVIPQLFSESPQETSILPHSPAKLRHSIQGNSGERQGMLHLELVSRSI
jgi:hypothetical protein